MKIISTGLPALPAAAIQETPPAQPAQTALRADPGEHQSTILQAAQAALRAMPEIDEAKVAQLREALARGEIKFDVAKLAGLIARYHGGRE